jgi:hypothetical protein
MPQAEADRIPEQGEQHEPQDEAHRPGHAALLGLAGPALAAKDHKAAKAEKTVKAAPKAAPVVTVDVPPPSGTWEATPPAAEGWTWSAGYHKWDGARYVWAPGEWIATRPGQHYRQHRWVERDGKWTLTGGDWVSGDAEVVGKH